jgi:branched-chain amino acid transport system permease protein
MVDYMSDKKDGLAGFAQKLRVKSIHAFVVGTILLAIFPLAVKDPYILHIIIIALVFSVLAASWNLMVGYIGIFSFGHHAFFGVGAYVSALLAMKAGVSPWFGLIIAGIVAACLSFIIGLPCLRLRAAPYIAIATLAFAEISRITCMNLVGLTRGESGLWGIPYFPNITLPGVGVISFAGGVRIPYYYLILIIFIIAMTILYFGINSHIGLALRSIRDSQEASESLGINITYYKLLAFMVAGFFAGVVGSFYAHYLLIMTPTSVLSLAIMIDIVVMTFVGGLSTFMGPVLGAFIITIGLEYLRILEDYRFIAYGILLVVMMLFMPSGIGIKVFREKQLLE